jgi:RecA-family ATPase
MTTPNITIEELHHALGGEICRGKNGAQVLCPGPGHSQRDRSLAVAPSDNRDGFMVHSFANDDPVVCKDYVRDKLRLQPFRPYNGKAHSGPTQRKVAKTYDYTDETGQLLFQVVRFEPKNFRQRRPGGNGEWIWNLDDVRRVPYRLPELIEALANGSPVFVVEGEKDVDALRELNIPATCNPQGAGKWRMEYSEYFSGATVYVLADNDDPGRAHARQVSESLTRAGATVSIIGLPGLPNHGDASDWIKAGGTSEQLYAIAEKCSAGGEAETSETGAGQKAIPWLDMSNWDGESVPERKWAIRDRVPLNQAGLFSGEGGTGKSIIELMKDVAHVAGKDWLHSVPEPGPAFYIGAEDDKDELHIRLVAIAKHHGVTFDQLIKQGLYVLCLLGQDATLCVVNRSGSVETTALYKQLYEAGGDIKPKNISIDTLSRAFAGNELDRVQVYAFAMHMQALAMVANGSVTVLSHPSLQGMASGTGISGSTAWHGAFRFRQYLKGIKPDGGEQPDGDLRELEFKKNQYGPLGEPVVVRYRNGLFLPEGSMSNLDTLAKEATADQCFLNLVKRLAGEGRNVSEKPNSPTYAPTTFAKEHEAKTNPLRKSDLEAAMRRLFASGKICVESYGRPSRPATRIAIK